VSEIDRLTAENADLRSAVDQLRSVMRVIGRVFAVAKLQQAMATVTDEDLRAVGLNEKEIATIREMGNPLPNFSWLVPDQVAGCGRPRGAEAVKRLADLGVRRLITLTEEPLPTAWLEAAGVEGLHLPVLDFATPSPEQLEQAVGAIEGTIAAGGRAVVHCAAGWGRTGTVLAALLVRRGMAPAEAIGEVRRLRPGSIETPAQEAAVYAFRG
jgi:atypical dual specificity phosphatase